MAPTRFFFVSAIQDFGADGTSSGSSSVASQAACYRGFSSFRPWGLLGGLLGGVSWGQGLLGGLFEVSLARRDPQTPRDTPEETPDQTPGPRGPRSTPNMSGRPGYRTMEMNGGSSAPYLARTPCVPLCVHCLVWVETEGFLDYQGRAGIISIVRWNLRPVIFGVDQRPFGDRNRDRGPEGPEDPL